VSCTGWEQRCNLPRIHR